MANWLFEANPERYDVFADLRTGTPIKAWSIGRHRADVVAGDRAALWVGCSIAWQGRAGRRRGGAQWYIGDGHRPSLAAPRVIALRASMEAL